MDTDFDVDNLIERLLKNRSNVQRRIDVEMTFDELRQLCIKTKETLLSQPMLLELKAPINVIGDISGHYIDLLYLFQSRGFPPESNYLFLGNYVDRGRQSLETICLLFAFKIKYPDILYLLRGNHECGCINRVYGFYEECKRRFNIKLWKMFNECFNCLPVAAIINEKIFCCHGGLSPDLQSLDQIRNIVRPIDVSDKGIICDLLWADPERDLTGWNENEQRRISVVFGEDIVEEFLQKHNMQLICRSHQIVENGYEFFANKKLVTITTTIRHSADFYRFDFDCAIMRIEKTLECLFYLYKPAKQRSNYSNENEQKKHYNTEQ